MTDLTDESIDWTERANDPMGLATMIDELYNSNLCKFSEDFLRFEPRGDFTKGIKEHSIYYSLYTRHKELLLDIVEIFFPNLVFVPSQINKKGSSEFFLFIVIQNIYYITWYQEIEKSRPRGYEKENEKLNKALDIIRGYAVYREVTKLIDFPKHQNEIVLSLSAILKKCRPRQEERIIKLIKKYFDIKSLKDTKNIKIAKGNRKMIEFLKKEGLGHRIQTKDNPTDDDIREFYIKIDKAKNKTK